MIRKKVFLLIIATIIIACNDKNVNYDAKKKEKADLYEIKEGSQYKGDDVMRELVVAYEGCPVPTNNLGYMGTIDGKWCITVGNHQKDKIDCYYILEEYIPNLEKYWS